MLIIKMIGLVVMDGVLGWIFQRGDNNFIDNF